MQTPHFLSEILSAYGASLDLLSKSWLVSNRRFNRRPASTGHCFPSSSSPSSSRNPYFALAAALNPSPWSNPTSFSNLVPFQFSHFQSQLIFRNFFIVFNSNSRMRRFKIGSSAHSILQNFLVINYPSSLELAARKGFYMINYYFFVVLFQFRRSGFLESSVQNRQLRGQCKNLYTYSYGLPLINFLSYDDFCLKMISAYST